ncbi:MAG: PadR family transcriptional regulator, partial [Paenibacillus sp.]|nr:PadR family transcriptional regulator [Paenibacillus sp.]
HGSGRRHFGRGRVKLALLELLREQPMHGYQMIKSLEEKSGGLYAPSPGVIYPTLQMLEDRGLVLLEQEAGRKAYKITEEGRHYLQRKSECRQEGNFLERWSEEFNKEDYGVRFDMRQKASQLNKLVRLAAKTAVQSPQHAEQISTLFDNIRSDLQQLIESIGVTPAHLEDDQEQGDQPHQKETPYE